MVNPNLSHKRPPSDETLTRLDHMVGEGYSLTEISRTLRIGFPMIRRYHPEYKGLTAKEGASLGAAARIASLRLERKRYGFNL